MAALTAAVIVDDAVRATRAGTRTLTVEEDRAVLTVLKHAAATRDLSPRLSRGGFRTRREAEQARAELVTKVNKGTYVMPTRLTVAEYLREWLAAAKIDLRASTIPGYENAVEKHLIPGLGATLLQTLGPHQITAFYAGLLESGRCDGSGGLSPRSVRIVHAILHRALSDAVEAQLLERNPAARARPPKAKTAEESARKARRFWSAEEAQTFLRSLHDHPLRAALHLAVSTGLRRGELLALRWRDLALDDARLEVVQTLTAPRGRLVFGEPKTRFARRSVDLDGETVAVLREHRKRQLEERLRFGPAYLESDLLFRQPGGSPVHPHQFTVIFKRAVKAAGLPPLRFHDVRHSHVALLARAGVPAKVIQERVGHHSAGFTLDNYGGTFPSQHRDAVERFAALVGGSPERPAAPPEPAE
jgi:integrase